MKRKHGVEKVVRHVSRLDPYAADIRRMYVDEGLTDERIVELLPVSVNGETLRAFRMKKLGIPSDRHRKVGRFTMDARYEEIKDELAAAWERSKRRHPVQKRDVGSARRRPVIALFNDGWSVPRIAKELGATQDSIRNWLRAAGCDLSDHFSRMSHEEKIAWRRSISEGKAGSVAGSGRYSYGGTRLDSPQEVTFVKNCDRLGLEWCPYDRAVMGVCEVSIDGEVVRYAPDLVVGDLHVEVKGIYNLVAATKVRTWREQRGPLALIMKHELFEFEAASSTDEAMQLLEATCFLDPEPETAFWESSAEWLC